MDTSGDRDVFYHYEKRIKRVQWWFESRKLSISNNNANYSPPQSSGTYEATLPLNTRDNYFGASNLVSDYSGTPPAQDAVFQQGVFDIQWPAFFPDAAFDQIFGDWVTHTNLPSDHS
jgi:hypothetical protein